MHAANSYRGPTVCISRIDSNSGPRSHQELPKPGMDAPWITLAASLHRKTITWAMSSGLGHFAKSALGIAFRFAWVSMMLGSTEFARTPVPFKSSARESIIATAAALDAT